MNDLNRQIWQSPSSAVRVANALRNRHQADCARIHSRPTAAAEKSFRFGIYFELYQLFDIDLAS
jgi:hypothetical protein